MITPPLVLLALGLSPGADAVPEPVASMALKLKVAIVRNHYPRVGVIPCFLQREGEVDSWGATMGAQGEWLAESFVEALRDASEGLYRVEDGRSMARVFAGLAPRPADLADRKMLAAIAREAGGLDALVVGRVVDVREPPGPGAPAGRLVRSDVTANLIDLRTGALEASAYRGLAITPALAAYRGESAETGAFTPIALAPPAPDGKGANTPNLPRTPSTAPPNPPPPARSPARDREKAGEREGPADGATSLGPAAPGPGGGFEARRTIIPLVDDPNYPFPVQVLVDDAPRPLFKVIDADTGRGRLYVNLEPGESYEIAVRNRTGKTVYGVVYVDGLNILGVRRDPENPRFWNMAPGQDCRFRAWYVGSAGNYKEIRLKVGRADDSIAVQKGSMKDGFADRMGEIQCIFFATEGEAPSEVGAKSLMLGKLGTRGGDARDITIPEIRGPKRSEREMLSFVIHYAPKSWIEQRPIVKD